LQDAERGRPLIGEDCVEPHAHSGRGLLGDMAWAALEQGGDSVGHRPPPGVVFAGGADGHLLMRVHGPVPKADVHVIVDDRLRRVRDRVGDLLDPRHRVLADGREEVGDIGMGRIDQRLEQSTLRMRAPAGGGQPRSHVRVGMAATAQVERLGDLRPR